MNFWIAVAVFCIDGQCAFWKSDENYYKQSDCEIAAMFFMEKAELELPIQFIEGVCLPIKIKDQT
jgi:hypothetical protein